jgi:hypothetical protein
MQYEGMLDADMLVRIDEYQYEYDRLGKHSSFHDGWISLMKHTSGERG